MAVTLTNIESIVRNLIGDDSHTMSPGDIFIYSTSAVFTLTESSVISVSTVLHNDAELGSGEWSYDSDTNKVTVSASLTSSDIIEIRYTYYPNYSVTEIQNQVKSAISHLSINNYKTWIIQNDTIFPEPEEREKNLIGVIASILINPPIQVYRLPDITLNYPREINMHDKISKTISIFKKNVHGVFDII